MTSLPARVVQIVPRLPPSVDGVGDYALGVARELRDAFGMESRFVVCSDPAAQPLAEFAGVSLPAQRGPDLGDALIRSLAGDSGRHLAGLVILHYVGYAYAADGAPVWLVEALEKLVADHPGLALATVFHELYATAAPWRRAFWHAPAQKKLSRRVRASSRYALCTIERNGAVLRRWSPTLPLEVLPVPSSLAEPRADRLPPWEHRLPRLVLFGRPHSRELGYRRRNLIQAACARFNIEEIIDIGPPLPAAPSVAGIPVRTMGVLPTEQLSEILANSRYGFLYYPADFLAKSSIFAAYCAHAMCSIVPDRHSGEPDGLAQGRHYLSVAANQTGQAPEAIANDAYAWYQPHRINAHAAWVARLASEAGRHA